MYVTTDKNGTRPIALWSAVARSKLISNADVMNITLNMTMEHYGAMVLTFLTGLSLLGQGLATKCQTRLTTWMICAGTGLGIMTLVALMVFLWRRKRQKNAIISIGWGLCCGLLLILALLVWLAFWITGSYLAIHAIQTLRVKDFPCPDKVTTSVAGVSILVIWTAFIAACVKIVHHLKSCNNHQNEYYEVNVLSSSN